MYSIPCDWEEKYLKDSFGRSVELQLRIVYVHMCVCACENNALCDL